MRLDRRSFMAALGSGLGVLSTVAPAAPRSRARVPGQWEPTDAIWLSPDHLRPDYMDVTARLIGALAPTVPLRLLVSDANAAEATRAGLRERGVMVESLPTLEHPDVRFFIREAALFAQDAAGRKAVVDFGWSTYGLADWCATYLYPDRPRQAKACADYAAMNKGVVDRWMAERLGATLHSTPVILEGGGYEFNGRGTVIVAEKLTLQRNPGRTLAELETMLLALPGVRKVVWMDEGLAEDLHLKGTILGDYVGIGTGGHVDEYVRFVGPRTIFLAWVEDHEVDDHPLNAINRRRMEVNLARLQAARDQDGRPLEIVKVPLPTIIEREEVIVERSTDDLVFAVGSFPTREGRKAGDKVTRVAASSYLNFLVCNGQVLLPTYVKHGTPAETERSVARLFARHLPRHRITFVDVTAINWGGGGLHCATLSEMRAGSPV